jgi:hypothetical protein
MRTTQDVANRYMELAKEGKFIEIQEELFADDVECIEPPHFPLPGTKGKEQVIARLKAWFEMVEERHDSFMTEPIVMGNYFTFGLMVDITVKGMGRTRTEEICVYGVKDGKIILEQFFF